MDVLRDARANIWRGTTCEPEYVAVIRAVCAPQLRSVIAATSRSIYGRHRPPRSRRWP